MKRKHAIVGLQAMLLSSLSSNENIYSISKNPESEKDKRKRQYQQELEDEWMISEYRLIQLKQSKLSANERRRIISICERKFSQEVLNPTKSKDNE